MRDSCHSSQVISTSRAFEPTLSVRKLGPEAKALADTFFFETLVRVHRASEGAPYTGLKPAGLDLGPAIPAADQALDSDSTEAVEKLLADAIRKGLREHFHAAISQKKFAPNDVAAANLPLFREMSATFSRK